MTASTSESPRHNQSTIELLIDERGRCVARDNESGLVGVGHSKALALTDLAHRLDTRRAEPDPLARKLEIEIESFR